MNAREELPEDRPYGPENPDYEHDARVQRALDGEDDDTQYPQADVLIARGKYSTLASERRDILKRTRETLEAIVGNCGRTLRHPEDLDFVREQYGSLRRLVNGMEPDLLRLHILHSRIEKLKPVAWGKEKPE